MAKVANPAAASNVAPPHYGEGGMGDDESQDGGPVSSFQSLQAEGELLAKQGDLRKAIEAYTKALHLRPGDKNCLVSRSKCYLQLGDPKSALQDAETSLKEDKDFFKGKFYKAEALYAMGDFEMALVYYHRGHNLRPELDEFRLGIQKAREAIDNSIGNPKDYKLKAPAKDGAMGLVVGGKGGRGFLIPSGSAGNSAGIRSTSHHASSSVPTSASSHAGGAGIGGLTAIASATKHHNQQNEKQLLGELYTDKEYLLKLLEDRDFIRNQADPLYQLVNEGLMYLETRTEFWRQQKPIYARRKEQHRIHAKVNEARHRQQAAAAAHSHSNAGNQHHGKTDAGKRKVKASVTSDSSSSTKQPKKPIIKKTANGSAPSKDLNPDSKIKEIKDLIANGKLEEALVESKAFQDSITESTVLSGGDKDRVLGNIYNIMGEIHLVQEKHNLALVYFQKDLGLNPSHVRSRLGIAQAQITLGQADAALEALNVVVPEQISGLDHKIQWHILQSQSTLKSSSANSDKNSAALLTINKAVSMINDQVSKSTTLDVYKVKAQACLANGLKEEAVESYKKAIDIAKNGGNTALAAALESELSAI